MFGELVDVLLFKARWMQGLRLSSVQDLTQGTGQEALA